MILSRTRSLGLACGLLLVASMASAASQDAPKAEAPPASEQSEPQPAPETAEREEAAEPERICRYVKLDMSSRRKTKVCRTAEEWRELNNIR